MLDLEEVLRDLFPSNYFSCRATNSLGVCGVFPNHTFQVRGKLRLKHKFPDSLLCPLSAMPQPECPSFPGATCLAVDKETERASGTTGVTAVTEHSSRWLPGPPAFSLLQQPRWELQCATVQSNYLMRVFEPNYMEVFIQWKERGKRKGEIKLKCKSVKGLDPVFSFFLIKSEMRGEFLRIITRYH